MQHAPEPLASKHPHSNYKDAYAVHLVNSVLINATMKDSRGTHLASETKVARATPRVGDTN